MVEFIQCIENLNSKTNIYHPKINIVIGSNKVTFVMHMETTKKSKIYIFAK